MLKDLLRNVKYKFNDDKINISDLSSQIDVPDDMWLKCPKCNVVLFRDDVEREKNVCIKCGYHFRLSAKERIYHIADEDTFIEYDENLSSLNPLNFDGYKEKVDKLKKTLNINEAVICGECKIDGEKCNIAVMDSNFMMGSMGSVVGEKITRVFERAVEKKEPVVLFSASGGARMQEGIISLMQMAKTSAAVKRHSKAGLLYIVVFTDPTTGGVTASFASLADITISEPKTLIGFAGRRVVEGTIKQKLPDDFQSAEFLLEHGFVDMIVHRKALKKVIGKLLRFHHKEE